MKKQMSESLNATNECSETNRDVVKNGGIKNVVIDVRSVG
jgi:hypothetical protein